MAAPREIPGFYYDTAKRKYFKIEASHTAPSSSTWSAESVKRQKIEKQQADKANLIAEKRKLLVKRSKALQDPLLGGFLTRELGRRPRDHLVDCWSKGLCPKGHLELYRKPSIPPGSSVSGEFSNLDHIVITNGDGKSRTPSAYGVRDEHEVRARYLPTDEHDSVLDGDYFQGYSQLNRPKAVLDRSQISSMKYHGPSNKVLLTSRQLVDQRGDMQGGDMVFFTPELLDDANPTTGMMGVGNRFGPQQCRTPKAHPRPGQPLATNTCAPAPVEANNLLAVVGSNQGILQLSTNGRLTFINHAPLSTGHEPNEVLSLSFLPKNPNIIFAGARTNKISIIDLRAPETESGWIRHKSAVAHVHGINEHQVLAAGPKSAMSIYDLRFTQGNRMRNMPVVRFPEYRNTASIHIGLDVDTRLGIVAAASEDRAQAQDGRVYLYSLESGKRLDCPALTQVRAGRVLKAVVFQTMPREEHASLFVGVGQTIQKFSFGERFDEWTGEELKAERK